MGRDKMVKEVLLSFKLWYNLNGKQILYFLCICSVTHLPIIAKGILRGDDAIKAAEAGCSAVLVSNHGARQLDGVPATVITQLLLITIES